MNNLDKIYIINLKERTDRKKKVIEQLKKNNIINYKIIEAIKPSINDVNKWNNKYCNHRNIDTYKIGCLGCLKSHLFIYNDAIKNDYNNILILEDDFLIKMDLYKNVNLDFCIENNYGVFYLGGSHYKKPVHIKNNIYKCIETHTTHAYIISKQCIKYIINNINNWNKEIDVYLSNIIQKNFNCYCLYPSLITQSDGISDIQNKYVNYNI